MKATVRIPSQLRQFSNGATEVVVESEESPLTVAKALDLLAPDCVGVRDRTLDDQGNIRAHVNVFLNDESVRDLSGLSTEVEDGDVLWILPAVSGGSQMKIRAPQLPTDQPWLNVSRPLTSEDLRGRVVILDFWTYC